MDFWKFIVKILESVFNKEVLYGGKISYLILEIDFVDYVRNMLI